MFNVYLRSLNAVDMVVSQIWRRQKRKKKKYRPTERQTDRQTDEVT